MSDLTARLLAEIERLTDGYPLRLSCPECDSGAAARSDAILAALRKVVERHRVYLVAGDGLPICAHCDRRYPCVDLMDVAEGLGVAL